MCADWHRREGKGEDVSDEDFDAMMETLRSLPGVRMPEEDADGRDGR